MNQRFKYVGCFVDLKEFQGAVSDIRIDPLENEIHDPHITFLYRPEKTDRSLFGKSVQITILGYGNNGENEGVKVSLHSDCPQLQSMIEAIEVPHITIAVSNEGRPVNTAKLQFTDIEPIELTGIYGGYSYEGNVCLG